MGYRPARRILKLRFDQYPGLKIQMRSTDLGTLSQISSMDMRKLKYADQSEQRAFFELITDLIVSWNMEHPDTQSGETCKRCGLVGGDLLPYTVEGIMCLDLEFFIAITMAWAQALTQVSIPKGISLSNGGRNGPEIPQMGGITEETMSQLGALQNLST